MTAPIQIDDLLKNFGMNRELLIKKNPKYQDEFVKLDKYYQRYQSSPSDSLLKATNNITLGFLDKLKNENPEMFVVEEKDEAVEIKVEDKFSKYRKDMDFYLDEGDQDAMDDLFNMVGEKNTKSLLTYENFKVFHKALRSKNVLIITHLFDVADRLKFFPDAIMGRDGEFIYLILKTGSIPLVKHIFDLAEKNGNLQQVIMVKNGEYVPVIFGLKDPALIKRTTDAVKDHKYGPYAIQKAIDEHKDIELDEESVSAIDKVSEKAKTVGVTADEANIDQVLEMLASGIITMDTPLVNRLERKFAIRILDSAEEIANGKSATYRFVVPTVVSQYFDEGKKLYSDKDYTIYQKEKSDFEKHFGTSVYELGICWFNLLNLVSIEDVLAIFYVANISTSLMVDRANKKLRSEYLAKLKFVIENPVSNKIAGQYFIMKEANLVNLKKSGFLDDQYCPTKLLYCAIVLHSFPFPAYTHPFEFIEIGEMSSMFQFQTVKGEFGNETFYTDGDVLFHNFTDAAVTKFAPALTDVSRTTILNLKSTGRSDITKQKAVINHFIPFIYSVPKSGVFIPTFQLRVLDVPERKINWGVYELQNNEDKIYINSYALSSVLVNLKQDEYNLMTYKGTLSDTIFASPNEGVIIQHEKTYLAIRGIRGNEFLSANFGANWEKYYQEMFSKQHLNSEVLNQLDPDMVKAIHTSSNVLIGSTETGLQYKVEKKYAPTFQKEVVKPAPQKKIVTVQVPKKDDRVYISSSYASKNLDKELMPIFDKIQNLRGEQRDEAILDEMYAAGVDRIFPRQLLYMGFGLKEYVTDKPERINFKNKYKLTIPILLSFEPTYYLEKI